MKAVSLAHTVLRPPSASVWAARGVTVSLLALSLMGSFCNANPGKGPDELIQEQACIQNVDNGDYDNAQTRCDLCLEYNDRNYNCLNGLGLLWQARGDADKARKYYMMAIRENNDFAEGRNNMGVLAFENFEYEEAAKFFDGALEINPRFKAARYNLALSYFRIGQKLMTDGKDPTEAYAKAETQYRRMIELFPMDAAPYNDLGSIMTYRAEKLTKTDKQYKNFVDDAEQYFVRCLEIDGSRKDCRTNLAHLYLGTSRFDDALFHFVQCLAVDKDEPICLNELQLAYRGSQLKSEALQKYMRQLAENPGYGQGHFGFCQALFDKGLVDMAVTECENALKLDPTICLAHYQLAEHYKAVLDKDLAIANCRSLLRCAGETKHHSEVETCKVIIRSLEAQ
jgi:tetratricopeptide (TPR) repeat protein